MSDNGIDTDVPAPEALPPSVASRSRATRVRWGAGWMLGVALLTVTSYYPFALVAIVIERALGLAQSEDPVAPFAVVITVYMGAVLIPCLVALNRTIVRQAVPGRSRWLAWPVSIIIIVLPVLIVAGSSMMERWPPQ